jgi:hypothetical protein
VGRQPALAYLAAPGLAALLAAPLAHAEPLFGVGAALLLIAAYAGGAYRFAAPVSSSGRSQRSWRQGGALLLVFALMLLLRQTLAVPAFIWPLWAALGLCTLAFVLSRSGQPQPRVRGPGLALRFGAFASPAWPDLELRFDGDQARLYNIGGSRLLLAGWSPSGANCWIRPQYASGQPLSLLPKGSVALLSPWPDGQNGVRVWYVRQNEPETALIFKADWTPLGSSLRVLN